MITNALRTQSAEHLAASWADEEQTTLNQRLLPLLRLYVAAIAVGAILIGTGAML